MWINSPLGKWEQNARVKMALSAAERMRMLDEAQADDGGSGLSAVLYGVKARLPWQAKRVRQAADAVQAVLVTLRVKAREPRQAS